MALFDQEPRLSCPRCGKKEFIVYLVRSISLDKEMLRVHKPRHAQLECISCGTKSIMPYSGENIEYLQEE